VKFIPRFPGELREIQFRRLSQNAKPRLRAVALERPPLDKEPYLMSRALPFTEASLARGIKGVQRAGLICE
jgi:hypothetical protein